MVLAIEPRALNMLGMHSTNQLHPQSQGIGFISEEQSAARPHRKRSTHAGLLDMAEWMMALDQGQVELL